MASLQTMILNNNDKLNDSEKKIIQFIVNNPESCSKLSLSKLAKKLYVSESAIFRLCKKLGLSGYSELKFDLNELANSKQNSTKVIANFATSLKKANEDVQRYFEYMDLSSLYEKFDNAHTIYIYSTGWQQQLIAQYLAHQLFIVGKHATILPAAVDELKSASLYAKKGDVLFIISFNGDGELLNKEISKLKLETDKFTLISFTNMKQNALASLTQFNIYFPTVIFVEDKLKDQKRAFTPAYMLIDLLISDYINWQHQKED